MEFTLIPAILMKCVNVSSRFLFTNKNYNKG
jgi:hypothetical protein